MFYIMFLTGMRIVRYHLWVKQRKCSWHRKRSKIRLKGNWVKDIDVKVNLQIFCSRCFEKGMNPKVVQALMGHQHYSTTIEIYTHVTEQKFDDEIAKFGNAIN